MPHFETKSESDFLLFWRFHLYHYQTSAVHGSREVESVDGSGVATAVSSPFFYILRLRPSVRPNSILALRVDRRSGDHSHAVGINCTSVAKLTRGALAIEGFHLMVEK